MQSITRFRFPSASATAVTFLAVLFVFVSSAFAQDVDPNEANAAAATSPGEAAAPAPPANQSSKSVLSALMDGGVVGFLILCLSVVSVGLVIEHAMTIRKATVMPERFLADVEPLIAGGNIDQAIETCLEPENESLAANVVLAGLERFRGSQFGFAEYKSAVEEAGEDQTGQLYRKTEILGLIGAVSPMLGLTGTVLGMIVAFNTIADSGGMAKPDELADGISQALVTTLLGLIVAIPTMVAYSFFRNRIDSLVSEAGNRIERIMMPLGRRG